MSPPTATGGRRADVVAAAARLFSENGYHGTSMAQLASAVGMLRGSLYAHISAKEELLFDVARDGAARFLQRAEEAAASTGGAAERVRAVLVGHIETVAEHLDAATVFLSEWRYLSDERRAEITARRDRYEGIVRGVIADGVASGEFRAGLDIAFAARLVLSAGNWAYTWYDPSGSLTPAQIAHRFADLVVQGMRP